MTKKNKPNPLDFAGGPVGQPESKKERVAREFQQALRKAQLEVLSARVRYQPVDLLPFEEVRQRLKLGHKAYRGIHNVLLDQIIGSVGRYDDFTRTFMPRKLSTQRRWEQVDSLIDQGGWPPVELYKVSEVYFVNDGNHRVSVARQQKAATIEAHVWEFDSRVPLWNDDNLKDIFIREEYLSFLNRTKLDKFRPDQEIILTERGRYWCLEEEIAIHRYYLGLEQGREPSFQEAVLDWYDTVYQPTFESIRTSDILSYFPGRTEADLMLWIIDHQDWLEEKLEGEEDVPIDVAAEDFTARTRRSLWRRMQAWFNHHILKKPVYLVDDENAK